MIIVDMSLFSICIERVLGFMDVLKDNGFGYDILVIEDDDYLKSDIEDFLKVVVLDKEEILVFVLNCWVLLMVFIVMKNFNFDMLWVGLVGFDNIEWIDFLFFKVLIIV